jgi:hypothetical protein
MALTLQGSVRNCACAMVLFRRIVSIVFEKFQRQEWCSKCNYYNYSDDNIFQCKVFKIYIFILVYNSNYTDYVPLPQDKVVLRFLILINTYFKMSCKQVVFNIRLK